VPRDITKSQFAYLDAVATKPIFAVKWQFNGTSEERFSTGETITLDGSSYTGGGVNISSISADSVMLTVPATATRTTQVQNSTWRGEDCQVYALMDTVQTTSYSTTTDAYLVMDGLIDRVDFRGQEISVTINQKDTLGQLAPVYQFGAVCNHMPAPGEVIVWEQEAAAVSTPFYKPIEYVTRYVTTASGALMQIKVSPIQAAYMDEARARRGY